MKERVTVPWRQTTATSPSPPVADEVKPVEDGPASQFSSELLVAHGATGEAPNTTENTAPEQPSSTSSTATAGADDASKAQEQTTAEVPHVRSLAWRNFEQALKEITPSASESLGSLAELRKWNDEFGEGRRTKKRQVWGKDRFGFTVPALEVVSSEAKLEPGVATPVVAPSNPTSSPNTGS